MRVSEVFAWLPTTLESLHLSFMYLYFDSSPCEAPANLRALCLDAYEVRAASKRLRARVPVFCMHAGLSRLDLRSTIGRVALECPDECVAAGIRYMHVCARSVVLDAHLEAEVTARGQKVHAVKGKFCFYQNLEDEVLDKHVVHIGTGGAQVGAYGVRGVEPWLCACGACCQCLGGAYPTLPYPQRPI